MPRTRKAMRLDTHRGTRFSVPENSAQQRTKRAQTCIGAARRESATPQTEERSATWQERLGARTLLASAFHALAGRQSTHEQRKKTRASIENENQKEPHLRLPSQKCGVRGLNAEEAGVVYWARREGGRITGTRFRKEEERGRDEEERKEGMGHRGRERWNEACTVPQQIEQKTHHPPNPHYQKIHNSITPAPQNLAALPAFLIPHLLASIGKSLWLSWSRKKENKTTLLREATSLRYSCGRRHQLGTHHRCGEPFRGRRGVREEEERNEGVCPLLEVREGGVGAGGGGGSASGGKERGEEEHRQRRGGAQRSHMLTSSTLGIKDLGPRKRDGLGHAGEERAMAGGWMDQLQLQLLSTITQHRLGGAWSTPATSLQDTPVRFGC
ncbi:hypothetical protein B0H13DRAFT_1936576 [Mycena leptocephala]|nr:hypothetical protein B0H13DRAFT_1936576 [Mycena leptocephala]